MRTSEKTGEIAAALAKAQAKFTPPKKDKTAKIESNKGGYSYHYSDLASLIDAIRGPLSENEIAYVQPTSYADGQLLLITRLMHSSGEWIESDYPLSLYARPQEQGSAITYARRYALGTLVGLAPEDDDGAAAQAAEPRRQEQRQAKDKVDQLDADIVEVAQSIVMAFGGNADELVGRASAFPKEKDPKAKKDASKKLDENRWSAPRSIVLAPHNQYITSADKLPLSEKWKRGTLARLIARRDALRAEPTDLELQAEMEGRDAEGENFQATDADVPW